MPASDQGTLKGRYTLVPRTLIFVTRGTRVLLLRGAPNKRLWANQYNGLGGHIERGEDALGAARRELLEEAGLVADLRLCGVITIDAGAEAGIGLYVFRGECEAGEPAESAEGKAEWIEIDQVGEVPAVEDLEVVLGRVLAQRPGDPPFSAHSSYRADGKMTVRFS